MYEIANKIFSDSHGNSVHIDRNRQYVDVYWVNDEGDLDSTVVLSLGAYACDIEDGIKDELDSWLGIWMKS